MACASGECFLGIDVGTSGTKVLALDANGTVLATASSAYALSTPAPGWVEQSPDDWWRAAQEAVRAVVEQLPGGAASVAGVSLSGHMSSVVAVGADRRPLRPCITLSDTRAAAEAALLDEQFGERVERLCGARPSAAAVAPRLLWLQRHEPQVYDDAVAFVSAKDYVRLLLTDELASEATDSGNTMLLDLATGCWDTELCTDIGLDPRKLPALVPTTAVAGRVTDAAAHSTGLVAGTAVVAGSADMAAATVGSGVVQPGVVGITIGTAAPVTTFFGALPHGGRGRVTFHPHAIPGSLYSIGSVLGGGVSLTWLASLLASGAPANVGSGDGGLALERLSQDAAAVPPGSDGAMFLPFLVGSGSPDFDGAMRGTFLGLSLATDRGRMARAVMEGVAFNIRDCVGVFRELGAPVERVHVGGGGAASDTWRHVLAGALGMPVQPLRVRDASALGCAALAAVGMGAFDDARAASTALVRLEEPVTPDAAAIPIYDRRYRVYGRAREALRAVYGIEPGEEPEQEERAARKS